MGPTKPRSGLDWIGLHVIILPLLKSLKSKPEKNSKVQKIHNKKTRNSNKGQESRSWNL